jgi:Tfp pilus assembly protein PilF
MKPANVRLFLLPSLIIPLLLLMSACASSKAVQKQASYHYQMGLSYLGENNPTGALVELTEAEKIEPDDADLQFNLGRAYFLKEHYGIAEQKFSQALKLKPDFPEARFNLGLVYLELKRWDDAVFQFKLVTDDILYQNHDLAAINLGIAYMGKGEYARALTTLRSVTDNDPRNPIAMVYLGQLYLKVDKVELAIMEFNNALRINKNYANAYYNLGLAYMKKRDNKAALAAFKEVVRITPESELGRQSREYLDLLK